MSDQIPAISKGTGGAEYSILVTAINDRLRRINTALSQQDTAGSATPAPIEYGTHAQRLGQPTPDDGTLFIETDRGGVIYRVAGSQWVYLSGEWAAPSTSLPAGLAKNDYGFKFFATDFWRRFEWAKTGGPPTNASPGWKRAAGELPSRTMMILPGGGGQMAAGWALCDGSATNVVEDDGVTVTSVTTPNMVGAYPKGGAYSAAVVPVTLPRISGVTEMAMAQFGPRVTDNDVGSGVGAASGTDVTAAGHPHTHTYTAGESSPGHQHALTAVNAPISLPDDPVRHVVVPWYMKR